MSTIKDTYTFPHSDHTSAEHWRRWLASLLKEAGFSFVVESRELESDVISAYHVGLPMGKVRVAVTEHLNWDGVSRTPKYEWATSHVVQIHVESTVMFGSPQELADKIYSRIERANLAELHQRPKVERANKPSKGTTKVAVLSAAAMAVLCTTAGILTFAVNEKVRDAAVAEAELNYLSSTRNMEHAFGVDLSDEETLDMGRRFCAALDRGEPVKQAATQIGIIRLDKPRQFMGTAIAVEATKNLCPLHNDKIKKWDAKVGNE